MNLFDVKKEAQEVSLAFDEHLKLVLERRYLDLLNISTLKLEDDERLKSFNRSSDLRLFRIDEIHYEGEASQGLHLLNIQNILSSIKNDAFSVVQCNRRIKISEKYYQSYVEYRVHPDSR